MFDKETKKIIARRFHKFFNINELPETSENRIDMTKKHKILVKYDGSLITPVLLNDNVRFITKGGFSHVSSLLEQRFLSRTDIQYSPFARHWLSNNYTPMFEYALLLIFNIFI